MAVLMPKVFATMAGRWSASLPFSSTMDPFYNMRNPLRNPCYLVIA
jgi:hypothetical protein